MEETEGKVDTMDRDPAMTFLPVASNLHIIQCQILQFFQSPWSEHNPGDYGVDQKDEGVGDSRRHTVVACKSKVFRTRQLIDGTCFETFRRRCRPQNMSLLHSMMSRLSRAVEEENQVS